MVDPIPVRVDDDGATTLEVGGPLTLAEAPRWRDALLAAIGRGGPVRLDLASAGPWDLAGLQLLLAAIASGRRGGFEIWLARVPRVFLEAAERAALLPAFAEAIEKEAPHRGG